MEFFERPIEEKIRVKPPDAAVPRGYQAFASRNLGKTYGLETPPDLREQFFLGPLTPEPEHFSRLPQARISTPRTSGRSVRRAFGKCSRITTGRWRIWRRG